MRRLSAVLLAFVMIFAFAPQVNASAEPEVPWCSNSVHADTGMNCEPVEVPQKCVPYVDAYIQGYDRLVNNLRFVLFTQTSQLKAIGLNWQRRYYEAEAKIIAQDREIRRLKRLLQSRS